MRTPTWGLVLLLIFCSCGLTENKGKGTRSDRKQYPKVYTFKKAAKILDKGDLYLGLWHYINLYPKDKDRVLRELWSRFEGDELLSKRILKAFALCSPFDPEIGGVAAGTLCLDRRKLAEKGAWGDAIIAELERLRSLGSEGETAEPIAILDGIGVKNGKLRWRELSLGMTMSEVESALGFRLPLFERDKDMEMGPIAPVEVDNQLAYLNFVERNYEWTLVGITLASDPLRRKEEYVEALEKSLPGLSDHPLPESGIKPEGENENLSYFLEGNPFMVVLIRPKKGMVYLFQREHLEERLELRKEIFMKFRSGPAR